MIHPLLGGRGPGEGQSHSTPCSLGVVGFLFRRFLLLLRLFLLFGEEVLPLFQQRIDRPLGNQIGPFLERLLLFQLLLEFGRFFLELLVQLFLVFGLFVLARRPVLRQVRRDVQVEIVIFLVGLPGGFYGVTEAVKRFEFGHHRAVHARLLGLCLG